MVFAQRIGLTLDEIAGELAKLPPDRAPTRGDWSRLSSGWSARIDAVLTEATLVRPPSGWMQRGGKTGRHSEHLGHLLAEMQSVHRAHPGATW